MSQDVVIREMHPDELQRLVEISLAAWEPIYAYYRETMGSEMFSAVHPNWREEKAGHIRRGCAPRDDGAVFVAELEGTAVGFVTCFVHSAIPAGEIGNNAVHPAYQGRGFAPRLYERAFDWLREKGMEYARVTTGGDPAHAPARRAYEKAGFDVPLPVVQYYREL